MKALMILGAVIGFLIGTGFGLAASSSWPTAFWRGCAVALAAGVLTRWWSGVWMRSLREALEQRRRAAIAAASAPDAKTGKKP